MDQEMNVYEEVWATYLSDGGLGGILVAFALQVLA
jgi:hypothetical protein